jgi:hypothetical protein
MALVQRGYLQDPQAAAASQGGHAPAAQEATGHCPRPNRSRSATADSFDGKRSLATTRMFLFDICERMFVRRDPKFALQMRDALREARDREAMLTIAALMLSEIEKAAGPSAPNRCASASTGCCRRPKSCTETRNPGQRDPLHSPGSGESPARRGRRRRRGFPNAQAKGLTRRR